MISDIAYCCSRMRLNERTQAAIIQWVLEARYRAPFLTGLAIPKTLLRRTFAPPASTSARVTSHQARREPMKRKPLPAEGKGGVERRSGLGVGPSPRAGALLVGRLLLSPAASGFFSSCLVPNGSTMPIGDERCLNRVPADEALRRVGHSRIFPCSTIS